MDFFDKVGKDGTLTTISAIYSAETVEIKNGIEDNSSINGNTGPRIYKLASMEIYVSGGEKLKGSDLVDATLTLDGSNLKGSSCISLVYAGVTYTGTIHLPYVFWNENPYVFANSSGMYTDILESDNMIFLTFHALVGEIWFESRQVYIRTA